MKLRNNLITLLFLWIFITPLFSQKSAEDIYSQYNDAVVRLFAYGTNNIPIGQGSGVIIKSKRWLVTNYHLTEGKSAYLIASHKDKRIKLDSVWAMDESRDVMI